MRKNRVVYYIKGVKLSRREAECIYYWIRGATVKQIGRSLGLSPRTVETHIENIKLKFNCGQRFHILDKVLGEQFSFEEFVQWSKRAQQ